MRRSFFSFLVLAVLTISGCALERDDLCAREFPRLRSDLAQEKTWLVATAHLGDGRSLASVSEPGSEEALAEQFQDARERAQDWALDRLALTQKAIEYVQRQDMHDVKPALTRLNNELVSYYGYATELNWKRMERRLVAIEQILDETQMPLCGN